MEVAAQIGLVGLVIAILLSLWRLARGPSVVDRILAFDAITVCVVGMIVLLSIRWQTVFFLELILIVSLLGFLTGVAFVVYLDKTMDSHSPDRPEPDDPNPPEAS